jgi:hypothetical protein
LGATALPGLWRLGADAPRTEEGTPVRAVIFSAIFAALYVGAMFAVLHLMNRPDATWDGVVSAGFWCAFIGYREGHREGTHATATKALRWLRRDTL